MATPDPRQILDTPMGENDAKAHTVRDYLIALLAKLWEYGEDFNGKRPFGNSGWGAELYVALVRAGHVKGALDDDGYLDDVDDDAANDLIASAIEELKGPNP